MASQPNPRLDDFLEKLINNRYSGAVSTDEAAAFSQAEQAVEAIAQSAKGGDSGGVRVLIRGHHANLGKITREFVESMVELGFSLIEPTGISRIDAIRRLAMLLWKIDELVRKLDESELILCRAIAEISKDKQRKIFIEPGASQKELEAYFKSQNQIVPQHMDEKLEDMAVNHVLIRDRYDHAGPFYRIVF